MEYNQVTNYYTRYRKKYKEQYEKHFHKKVSEIFMENRSTSFIYEGEISSFEQLYNIKGAPAMFVREDDCFDTDQVIKYIKEANLKFSQDDYKILYIKLEDAVSIIECKLYNNMEISKFENIILKFYHKELDAFLNLCYMEESEEALKNNLTEVKDIQKSMAKNTHLSNSLAVTSMIISMFGICISVILRFV